jgi:hypothetical protein
VLKNKKRTIGKWVLLGGMAWHGMALRIGLDMGCNCFFIVNRLWKYKVERGGALFFSFFCLTCMCHGIQ